MLFFDWFKKKPNASELADYQTDSPQAALLRREFDRHPSRGLSPARLAQILQRAEQGDLLAQAELFMDMEENDAHLAAELAKRKMAVKKLDWSLNPPRNPSAKEKKATQLLEDLIRDELDIGAIRMDMLDAIGHGYSGIELGWGKTSTGDFWCPDRVEHRPPTWFVCPPDDRNSLHLRSTGEAYGEPLTPFGWIVHLHKARSGYIARSGLHRVLAWPYLYKNYSVRDLAEFLEIYGLPIRIGKYPNGADPKSKSDLMKALLSIGHNAVGIIPDTMQFEMQQVIAGGTADGFKSMIEWAEASISKAILGGTLTSQTGANGNRSLGDVHNEVRMDIRDDDATQLDQTLSMQLIYPMAILNGLFVDNRCPSFVSDTQEPDDLALYADAIPKLVAVGAKIPLDYVNLKLKIPLPDEGEEILQAKSSPVSDQVPPGQPAGDVKPAALAALSSNSNIGAQQNQNADIDPTSVDSQTEQMASEAGASVKAMVDQIAAFAEQAESLEALRDKLLEGYGDLDASGLSKVMALGFAAAELSGRFDVEGEV